MIKKSTTKLRFYRNLAQLTQVELSLRSGVCHQSIYLFERGLRKANKEHRKKLATALGVDEDVLFPSPEDK
jgi:transcriptional regulator with XRE-family HTH domain